MKKFLCTIILLLGMHLLHECWAVHYAWMPIEALSEVSNQNFILTIRSGSPVYDENYAMQYNSTSALNVMSYTKYGVIVNPPTTTILTNSTATAVTNYAPCYYLNGSTKYYFQNNNYTNDVNWPGWTYQPQYYINKKWQQKWDASSKTVCLYYNYQSGNTQGTGHLGLQTNLRWALVQSEHNQISQGKKLADCNKATALTFWVRKEVAKITLDLNGGSGCGTEGYGYIDKLPWAHKEGLRLYGWSDGTKTYLPGERYPSSGYLDGTSEDVTLTAIFRHAEITYDPISSVDDLSNGDSVLIVIADGTDETNKYALNVSSTGVTLTSLNLNNVSETLLLGYRDSFLTSQSKHFALFRTKDLYYLNSSGYNNLASNQSLSYSFWTVASGGEQLVTITNLSYAQYYLSVSGTTAPYTPYRYNSKLVNQYDPATTLAAARSAGNFPNRWRIYKRNIAYTSTVHFDAGAYGTYSQGDRVATNVVGFALPNIDDNSLDNDYVFLGWYDGVDTLSVNSEYKPDEDITLHAVYERKQAYFDLQGHGTWSDNTYANKTIVGEIEDEIHYVGVDAVGTVTAEDGYRFLGWSTNKSATEPMYTGSQKVNVETPVTLYAVYCADYVFRLVSSVNEIADGDSVIIVVQSGNTNNPKAYSIVNSAKFDVTDYIQRDILAVENYKPYYLKAVKSGNTYAFCQYSQENARDCYLDFYTYTYSTPHRSSASYSYSAQYWTLTWLSASKRIKMTKTYTLAYKKGIFFVATNGVDQIANRNALNEDSGDPTYDNDLDGAYAMSIFKRYPLHTLTYNANGGVCDVTSEFGGSEALPEATKAGTDFLGWKDANGTLHYAGERYPATGAIADDETLTAEFRDAKREYTQVTGTSQIHNGDVLIFTIADGNGGSTRYVLESSGENVVLNNSQTFAVANTTKAHRFVANVVSSGLFTFKNVENKNYMYVTTGSYTTAPVLRTSPSTDNSERAIKLTSAGSGHFYMSSNISDNYGAGKLSYQPSSTGHLTKHTSTYNQYTRVSGGESLAAAVAAYAYPQAWTIYKEITTFTPAVTFDAGTQGICDKDTMMGFTITLPSVHDVDEGLSFGGWSDGVNTYPAGASYSLSVDVTLHATYETTRAHFIVNPTYGQSVPEQIGYTIEIPTCTPNTGYRFLGWSNNNQATSADPTIVIGSTVDIAQSVYYYAIFETLKTCKTYTRSSASELATNKKYLLVFEDGDGGPNKYMINITGTDAFNLLPLNVLSPQESAIMTYVGSGNFRNSSNLSLHCYRNGGGWMYLCTSGYTFSQYTLPNGGIYLNYYNNYNSDGYKYVAYTSTTDFSLMGQTSIVDQWAQGKSLAQVRSENKVPYNISIYKQNEVYAYYVHYSLYPSSANIASEEVCATYLPTASAFPAEYGEHFIGWATSPENADARVVAYQPGEYFSPTQDVTLYAVYDHMGKVRDGDNYYETFDAAIGDNKSNLILVEDITSNLVVNDGKNITLDAHGKTIDGSITVKQGGVLNLTATTAANACYIEATSGKSGQIKNADLINSSNIYVDIQLESTKSKADGRKWYGFAVPFNVDPTSGITNLENTETTLTSGVDFYIAKYSGTQRAATRDGWQYPSTDMLVPGQFYMITIDGSCNVWRFKKANGATKFASSELALSAYPSALGIGEANWNAMGNPCLEYSNISSASTEYGYIYNNATSAYTAYRLADYSFVVGCPIFLQAEGGTMVLNHTGILSQLFAPERSADTRDGFKVMLSNASTTDNLYVTASADAMPTYQTGKDVVKLGNALPMLWTEAYGMKLAAENAVLMDEKAEYDLHFYAPSAGIFTLSAERFMGDKQLDLYYAGQLVCTLSESPYTLDLQRGFNAGYRLVIHTPMGVSTDWHQGTGSVDSATKFIQDNQLYIRINGVIYNATGAIVK